MLVYCWRQNKTKQTPENSLNKSSGLKSSFPQVVKRHVNKWETWNNSPKHETTGR